MEDDLFSAPPVHREIYFVVPGEVRGKGRPRTRIISPRADGHGSAKAFASIYTDQKTKLYEGRIAACAMQAKPKAKWYGIADEMPALRMDVVAQIGIPKSWPQKKRAALDGKFHTQKPDGDNIQKAILDACQNVLYMDDTIVAVMTMTKIWVADPTMECLRVKVSTCV